MQNEIFTSLVTQNIVTLLHKTLLIMTITTSENYLSSQLVNEYKDVHNYSTEQCLQIDYAKFVAATLTSKEGSPPYPLIGSWTVSHQYKKF